MKKYNNNVIPIIRASYDKLTPVEKTIADFFISNDKVLNFSAAVIAKKLHVSEASMSRFAEKIGFKGYREFIYHYQPSVEKKPQMEEETLQVLYSYEELLHKTYDLLQETKIKKTVQLISEKKRIFLYGFGSSGLAAQEFRLRLIRLGMDAEAITELHQMILNEARITKDCLVIGISLSGATREVTEALDKARQNSAGTVYMTSFYDETVHERYDEVIQVPVKENLKYGNVISPQFPILLILDLIYAQLFRLHLRNTEEEYDANIWKKIKEYHV